MDFAQLVSLYFERSTALQNYWTLYVVIIGGLLAFSSMRQRPNRLTTVLISILFICFAYKNCGAIGDATHQRIATLEAIKATAAVQDAALASSQLPGVAATSFPSGLLPTLAVPSWPSVRNFHIFSDVLTILTLWSMELRRRIHERERTREAVETHRG